MKMVWKNLLIAALLLGQAALVNSAAQAQTASTPTSTVGPSETVQEAAGMPSAPALTVLVQASLGALNDANLTGDYSVLIKRGSAAFQRANSNDDLLRGFAPFRERGIDLSPSVIYPITWSQAPMIEGNSLRLVGAIESQPQAILFDLGYMLEDGKWRLAAISVGLAGTPQ